ncbi:MAG: hypothetical protein IPO63_04690 [Bacteroidetes bacterium]|nr:hypothetical protein [Bacteroidota bacterium]
MFIYRYAVVLEDPSHTVAEQPRFEIRVYDQNGLAVGCGSYNVVASAGIPGFVSIVNSQAVPCIIKIGPQLELICRHTSDKCNHRIFYR